MKVLLHCCAVLLLFSASCLAQTCVEVDVQSVPHSLDEVGELALDSSGIMIYAFHPRGRGASKIFAVIPGQPSVSPLELYHSTSDRFVRLIGTHRAQNGELLIVLADAHGSWRFGADNYKIQLLKFDRSLTSLGPPVTLFQRTPSPSDQIDYYHFHYGTLRQGVLAFSDRRGRNLPQYQEKSAVYGCSFRSDSGSEISRCEIDGVKEISISGATFPAPIGFSAFGAPAVLVSSLFQVLPNITGQIMTFHDLMRGQNREPLLLRSSDGTGGDFTLMGHLGRGQVAFRDNQRGASTVMTLDLSSGFLSPVPTFSPIHNFDGTFVAVDPDGMPGSYAGVDSAGVGRLANAFTATETVIAPITVHPAFPFRARTTHVAINSGLAASFIELNGVTMVSVLSACF